MSLLLDGNKMWSGDALAALDYCVYGIATWPDSKIKKVTYTFNVATNSGFMQSILIMRGNNAKNKGKALEISFPCGHYG